MSMHPVDREAHAALIRRLQAAGVAASVAEDLVARFPAQHIGDALEVLPARRCSNAAGWLVRAISDGWQLHDEAERLRAARTRNRERDAATRARQAHEERRAQRLAGWATAISAALTDPQLAAAIARVTTPVDGLDRRSVPVAASQLLAWVIASATAAPDLPLEVSVSDALHDHANDGDIAVAELPDAIPPAPATNAAADPEAFRRRVRHAVDDLDASHPSAEARRRQRCTVGTRTDLTPQPP